MNSVRYFLPRRVWITAICALALAGCGGSAEKDPVSAVNDFFTDLSKQHYREAYENSSVPFKIQLSETAFEAVARDSGLGNFISCSWTPVAVSPKEAQLDGVFVTRDNQSSSLRVTMLRESGRWKFYSLYVIPPQDPARAFNVFNRINNSGSNGQGFNDVFARKIPNDDEVRKLVTETMQKFNECLHKKDFGSFYEYTSSLWQSQTTEAQVARAFKPFVDKNQTLDFIANEQMIFDEPPRLNSDGYLLVNGYYPTRPRVEFHLQYIFELPRWRIVGISLTVD